MPLHPLSAWFAPWLAGGMPELATLNRWAAARGIVSGGGTPICFDAAPPGAGGYEEQIFACGRVPTRRDNWHDLFNALVWLEFPLAKAALNRRHVAALRAAADTRRGPLRDALTQFDECGVIVLGRDASLWQALCAHRWREVFVARRDELLASTRFLVFGHASHDALRAPFVGLCGKAVFLELDATAPTAAIDRQLADWVAAVELAPRELQPLPLLGIPGATAENEDPAYYDDGRQFRPPRAQPTASTASISAKVCATSKGCSATPS